MVAFQSYTIDVDVIVPNEENNVGFKFRKLVSIFGTSSKLNTYKQSNYENILV